MVLVRKFHLIRTNLLLYLHVVSVLMHTALDSCHFFDVQLLLVKITHVFNVLCHARRTQNNTQLKVVGLAIVDTIPRVKIQFVKCFCQIKETGIFNEQYTLR